MHAFFNHRFVSEKDAGVSAFDRGLLYGDGLFETMRIYGGSFFRLGDHLLRLHQGLEELGIKIPYNRVELEFFLRELAIRNSVKNGFARIVVTRGEGLLGFSPRGSGVPQIIMVARSRNLEALHKRPLIWRLCVAEKPITGSPFKSLSYLPNVIAKKGAEKNGFDDAVQLNAKGEVVEVTASNIFAVSGRSLWTPPLSSGCLDGVTRKIVIKIAEKSKIHISQKPMKLNDLKKAEEIFVTNSLLEIMPCVLGKKVPARVPVYTLAWQEKFQLFRNKELE